MVASPALKEMFEF